MELARFVRKAWSVRLLVVWREADLRVDLSATGAAKRGRHADR
jgi:hypothetical protein